MAGSDVTGIISDAWPFVSAAIAGYGAAVLKISEDSAADATVSLGRRILQRVFGRGQGSDALADLAADPTDPDLQAALRVALRKLLAENAQLATEVRDMVAERTPIPATVSNVVSNSTVQGPIIQASAITGDVTLA
jgi:hypothetical protein